MNRGKCKFIKENGDQCKAFTLTNSDYCLAHDNRPEIAKIRKDASKLAGLSQKILFPEVLEGKLPTITKPINIKKARDIKKAIVRTLQEIRFGELDIEMGRTLLFGLNILVGCIKQIELLERLEKLEKIAKQRGVIDGH